MTLKAFCRRQGTVGLDNPYIAITTNGVFRSQIKLSKSSLINN